MIRPASFFALGVSLLALAPVAQAQVETAAGAETGDLATDEIVVSARRREESVQDVPQTVNVVTAAQVEKLNLRTFQEIQTLVPGLTMTQTSSFSSQATVRGVAFVPEASGNNPSVEFYLNDAPISSGFLFQSTFDFGQFELQRGPQGTLRGRASPSGSISVRTRRPDLTQVGMTMNGTATDRAAYKLDGSLNIPIIRDMLAIRLAGVVDRTRGGNIRTIKEESDPANNEAPFRQTESYRASVRFEPTSWIAANIMYQRLHAESHDHAQVASNSLFVGGAATTRIIRPFDRLSFDDQGSYGRQDHKVFTGNLDIDFAGQKLSYVGSYNKQDFASLGPQDQGDFYSPPRVNLLSRVMSDPAGFRQVCSTESSAAGLRPTTGTFYQCTYGKGTRKSHELRLASNERIGGIFDYVVGVFYDRLKNLNELTQETPIVNTTTGAITTVSRTAIIRPGGSTEKSAFGNLTAHLGKLELSAGLRYIDYKSSSSLAQGSTPPAPVTSSQSDQDHATIYNASVKYQMTPDIMVYALTGTSWRPGPRVVGDFSIGATGTGQTARELLFTNLPPEKSESYEIGLKTSFLDGRGRLNLSAYYQKFKNYPFRGPSVFFVNYQRTNGVIVPDVRGFNFVSPVPVKVKGVEAEASFRITERWSIGANASYSDGLIKNGSVACNDLNRDNKPDSNAGQPTVAQLQAALPAGEVLAACTGVGRRALNSPRFSANIQSEVGFPISDSFEGFGRANATIAGSTANDPDNSFDDIGSYGLLNLFVGLRHPDGGWEISAFAKNVLNERKILTVGSGALATSYRSPATNTFTSEYRSVSVNPPREFGISARIAIGSR